jgi:hypothetical protein
VPLTSFQRRPRVLILNKTEQGMEEVETRREGRDPESKRVASKAM